MRALEATILARPSSLTTRHYETKLWHPRISAATWATSEAFAFRGPRVYLSHVPGTKTSKTRPQSPFALP
jgi:hypothetical protein